MSRWTWAFLLAVTSALPAMASARVPATDPASDPPPVTPADTPFSTRLARITGLLDRGATGPAERELRVVLDDPALRDDALRAADALRECVWRCGFEAAYRVPDVAGLFGASSGSWSRRGGRLELVFDEASPRSEEASTVLGEHASVYGFHPRGFTPTDGVLLFDVPFSGRCQLAVTGRLPGHSKDRKRPPQLVLRVDEQLSYTVDYTWPTAYRKSRGLWSQGTVHAWKAGVSELLDTDPTPGGKYDMMWEERYDLKLVVKSGTLVASLQGYGMSSVRKVRRVYGRLGFRWCPSVERVSVSGIVEREVLDERFAAHRELSALEYRESAGARTALPGWLRPPQGD